jgi:hypothetical protein
MCAPTIHHQTLHPCRQLWAVVEEELVGLHKSLTPASSNSFRDLFTYLQELAEGKPVVHLGQSGPVLTLGEAEEVPNDLGLSGIETMH